MIYMASAYACLCNEIWFRRQQQPPAHTIDQHDHGGGPQYGADTRDQPGGEAGDELLGLRALCEGWHNECKLSIHCPGPAARRHKSYQQSMPRQMGFRNVMRGLYLEPPARLKTMTHAMFPVCGKPVIKL